MLNQCPASLQQDALPDDGDHDARTYARIAAAIRFLGEHAREQPTLADAAAHVHLSEHHFQRLFTAWAGVSPKRFLQHLTLADAKQRLAAGSDLAGAADIAGLSGTGRLHDLFVQLEAVTPGEFRDGGQDLVIHFGTFDTLFGPCFMAATERGICALHFVDDAMGPLIDDLAHSWPLAKIVEKQIFIEPFAAHVVKALRGVGTRPLPLLVKGTNLQIQVWRALLALPEGGVTTYTRLAAHVGKPRAVRAVANAVAANPVAWLIPCHRVIRASGELGGYRWGLERKRLMLAREAAAG